MRFISVVALLCAVGSTSVLADSIDINLHDKAIRGTYVTNISGTQGLSAEMGILHVEPTKNNSESLLHLGLLVTGENWSKSGTLDIAMGARVVYASPDPLELMAIAFGGRVRFSPVPRLGIGGHIYYAPDITSYLDSEEYREAGVRLDYQVLPQAFLYVGYRDVEADFGGGTWEMESEGHVGFKMTF
ncbi:MAG: YfaZ family protein [Chromatiales bacterium]|nr:YfaZ family protein [Chromatiales bacterium]